MNIIGHEGVIDRLKDSVDNNRVMPAYLFTGTEGIGKKLVAFYFAKMLNCSGGKSEPCMACESCLKIESGTSSDVILLTVAQDKTSIGLDEARELKRLSSLKPFGTKRKIFIIDRAEAMTTEAGNSFLKVLEDAEPSNVFILISSRPGSVLDTIKSRASLVKFTAFPGSRIAEILESGHAVDKKEAYFISRLASGSLGTAIQMAESGIICKKNEIIDKTNRLLYNDWSSISKDSWKFEDREDLREAISCMLSWLRDVYIVKAGSGDKFIYNIDRREDIERVSACAGFEDFEEMIGRLMLYDSYIDNNVNHKIIADAIVCDLLSLKS